MSLLEALRQPHALYVLEHAKALIPGIQRMVTCFCHDHEKHIWHMDAHDEHPSPLNVSYELLQKLASYRYQKKEQWVSAIDLEFDFSPTEKHQSKVFDELDKHVLILSFLNDEDKAYDCIFFYFNKDASNFGLRKNGDVLSTESKAIISNLLKQSLNLIIEQRRGFEKEVKQYKHYLQKLSLQYKKAKKELVEIREEQQNKMLLHAQQIVNELANETAYEIILTEQAKEKLIGYSGTRKYLSAALTNAVQFAIYSSPGTDMITLEDWHLDFDQQEQTPSLPEQQVDIRYQKTYAYLNKLEEAARNAYSQHLKLTSKNVGQAMTQPVSAPAISDALRNHARNIYSLFSMYPEQWSLIRKEFKPIANLIEKQRFKGLSERSA